MRVLFLYSKQNKYKTTADRCTNRVLPHRLLLLV